jgi:hypothetical protein
MSLGDKPRVSASSLSLFKNTGLKEKKNATLNVSFDINEREFLKKWGKAEGHSMAFIIKQSLKEFFLRHEMEHEAIIAKRKEKLKNKQNK